MPYLDGVGQQRRQRLHGRGGLQRRLRGHGALQKLSLDSNPQLPRGYWQIFACVRLPPVPLQPARLPRGGWHSRMTILGPNGGEDLGVEVGGPVHGVQNN